MSGFRTIQLAEELPLELGGVLPELTIAWEEWGDTSLGAERTIVVLPALSASSHVTSSEANPSPGWWEDMVGPGRFVDTDRYRVVCGAILGSPYGSTSPLTDDPQTGKPYGRDFPQITPADQARLHARLLDHLGLDRVHAVLGASLGGMQVLHFAALFPQRLTRFIALCTTGKTTPGTVAYRRVGRLAILNDPDYAEGRYHPDHPPRRGLAVARELGMITYRSREEFDHRFDWNPHGAYTPQSLTFEVERYLAAQGERFTTVFDANCYLLLSRCMDLMDLGAGQDTYADGVLRIQAPGMIAGVDHDLLIPSAEQRHLAHLLESHGRDVHFELLSSVYGHDAFLKEIPWFGKRVAAFLERA